MPQTLTEIRAILSAAGLSPQHRLGQNFMIDGNLMTKVAEAAEIAADCAVLEVGCGTGSLTEILLDRAGWVVGVEIDRGLSRCLEARFSGQAGLELIHADVLASKSCLEPVVLQAMQRQHDSGRRLMLVANLPYQIASPLMMNLLVCGVPVPRYCVVIQREVGERILAPPGGRDYGPMSVVLQACAEVRRVAILPPTAFWPVPKVESMAIRLDIHGGPFADTAILRQFVGLVRTAFVHRRKTLHYNLRADHGERLEATLAKIGVDRRIRAEALAVDQWLALFGGLDFGVA